MDRRQIVVALLVCTYGCVAYKLVKTDSGLKIGEARRKIGCEIGAKRGSLISVHYTGYFMNGTKFDSSLDSNDPFRLILGVCPGTRENPSEAGIIQGWAEGVHGMCVGERRKLIVPPNLGYGEEGKGDKIPGNSTLHFDVELVNLIDEASEEKLQEIAEMYNCTKIIEHSNNEIEAKLFLSRYDAELQKLNTMSTVAAWNYYTNLTEENEKINNAASLKLSEFNALAYLNASKYDTTNFSDDTKRQLKKVGEESLPEEEEKELNQIMSEMGNIYGATNVCFNSTEGFNITTDDNDCLSLSPGLSKIMATSDDPKLRNYVWQEWRKQAGRKIKPKYERYVELINKKSTLNGYTDAGDEWRSQYEVDNFEEKILEMYKELEPLYEQLHAYVRRKLYQKYGESVVDIKGKLPASLLSDMWGRFWKNLYSDVVPYPDRPNLDVSEAMEEQGYDVKKMFQSADDFYAGMGLRRVSDSFWNNSLLEKPKDGRKLVCHATAWDFYDGKDLRIKMCTQKYSHEDLTTVYHEMGHIQYYMQYSHQPQVYRDGANNGFHEAVGELMALASATPKYLHSIGLISEDEYMEEDPETDINFLMSQALITISTLPFHLVNDLWRWKIFRNEVPLKEWNTLFWKLKNEYVGVKAPADRSMEDLDPPTLFHISGGYTMMRYFTRTVLQFQFFEALCNIADPGTPLLRCDISGSEEAGRSLANMLKLGSSVPWPDALEKLTGSRDMSVKPILSFFEPLRKWLEKTNKVNGDNPGWV